MLLTKLWSGGITNAFYNLFSTHNKHRVRHTPKMPLTYDPTNHTAAQKSSVQKTARPVKRATFARHHTIDTSKEKVNRTLDCTLVRNTRTNQDVTWTLHRTSKSTRQNVT